MNILREALSRLALPTNLVNVSLVKSLKIQGPEENYDAGILKEGTSKDVTLISGYILL